MKTQTISFYLTGNVPILFVVNVLNKQLNIYIKGSHVYFSKDICLAKPKKILSFEELSTTLIWPSSRIMKLLVIFKQISTSAHSCQELAVLM